MKFRLLTFLLILFFVPKFSFAFSDPDTTKYELNDPRNPNCPCHAAQKLADDEYKRMLDQQRIDSLNTIAENNAHKNDNLNSSNVNTQKRTFHSKSKLKEINKQMRKSKVLRPRKTSGKKWKKGHLIDCGRF